MKYHRVELGLAAVLLALGATVWGGDASKSDKRKLQGTWLVVAAEINGKAVPVPPGDMITYVFSGDKVVMKSSKKKDMEGTYTLDATKKPKELDLLGPTKEAKDKMLNIYELDGDTLKLAHVRVNPSRKRPTAFDAPDAAVLILKREKKP